VAGCGAGGFLWYRRRILKLPWKQVFFIPKGEEDSDGSNIQVDYDEDQETKKEKRLLKQRPQTINIDDEEEAGEPIGSEVDGGFSSSVKRKTSKVPSRK